MSDINTNGSSPVLAPASAGRARRPAGMQLRDQEQVEDIASLDPATKSLADALKITYRLVQVAMVGLVGLYALSGFQSVQEGEEGIRLALGEVSGERLAPGFQMSLPAPFGELVRVQTSPQTIELRREFWPNLPDSDANKSPAELKNSARGSINPADDGSVMTADGNLGHLKVSVTYRRKNAKEFAQFFNPEKENGAVRAAVMRGVINACSALSIDEFLKDLPDPDRPGAFAGLATRAKQVAQNSLDKMKSGIEVGELNIIVKTPPLNTINDFELVQSAQSTAKQATDKAEQERLTKLAETAGDAAPLIIDLINRMDLALSKGDEKASEEILAKLDDVMDSKPINLDGRDIKPTISGRVASKLTNARQYRSSVVSRAKGDAELFEAKLGAYRVNPSVVLTGEWTSAYSKFLKSDNVEFIWIPPGTTTTELLLNVDPGLKRLLEVQSKNKAAIEQARRDNEAAEKDKFKAKDRPDKVSE